MNDMLLRQIDSSNTELAQEAIEKVLQKWPSEFDKSLFHHYKRYILLAEGRFLSHRFVKHHLRIVCYHYLMLKKLLRRKWLEPDKLDLELRLLPTKLHFIFGEKPVLGIAIVIYFTSPYERFEDEHILLGVQRILPHVQAVRESFWTFQKPRDSFRLLYLEIEKNQNVPFCLSEIALLKKSLKEELKKHVERLNPSTFGNNDLEETMRNIFFLSQEVHYPDDLPQVMISFEKALSSTLVFKVILVRVVTKPLNILQCFHNTGESVEIEQERNSIVGYLSNHKLPKEASVFRLHIPKKSSFIRSDFSFNLYQAREYVNSLITKALGEIRDYNGGIFSKQLELFREFKEHFIHIAEEDPELLEDFFYAISPTEMQATLPFPLLSHIFNLFLHVRKSGFPEGQNVIKKIVVKGERVFAIAILQKSIFQEKTRKLFENTQFSQEITTWIHLDNRETIVLGYIYQNTSIEKRNLFCQILEDHLKGYINLRTTQSLHFSQVELPVSLDPRLGGDAISQTIIKMLFEGLFRIGKDGEPELAVAKEVSISEDGKHYRIQLRECYWNNRDLIVAEDFCYSWKKILSPNFHSSFSHLFYPIHNAKQAKKGEVSLEQIGVKAIDTKTLEIDLEHPCPHFLELLAHPIYSPVNHHVDPVYPNWHLQTGQNYVCNGPFQLEDFDYQESYKLRKNSLYWDHNAVKIDHIRISKANDQKALEMYQKGETDWLGRPFCAWATFFPKNGNLQIYSTNYVIWYVCNVKQFPFNSQKLRQAFAYSIDRKPVVELIGFESIPAFSPIPLYHSQFSDLHIERDIDRAKELFNIALKEMGITHFDFPKIKLICPAHEFHKQISQMIIENWREVFEITVEIEYYSFKDLLLRMTKGEHQMALIAWKSEINTPLYTLESFKNANDGINFCKWENVQYQSILEEASLEIDINKRNVLYGKAEEILIQEMPVIPIAYQKEIFVKKNYLHGFSISKMGVIDFKHTYIKGEEV